MKHENIYKLTLTALMAALSYVIFTFLQIQITLPGGDATSFHLGNAVCVLGALLRRCIRWNRRSDRYDNRRSV